MSPSKLVASLLGIMDKVKINDLFTGNKDLVRRLRWVDSIQQTSPTEPSAQRSAPG